MDTISKMMQIFKTEEKSIHHKDKYYSQQVFYTPCLCDHCVNNTKPIPPSPKTQIISEKSISLPSNQAYIYILQNILNIRGVTIPDTLITTTSQIYFSSEGGKVRYKQKQSNLDFIKLYQQKKKKANRMFLSMSSSKIQKQTDKDKQVALFYYKNGHSQFVNENTLYQTLNKRKNYPAWAQIMFITLIPLAKKTPLQYEIFEYLATYEDRQYLQDKLSKVAEEIDIQDHKNNIKSDLIPKDNIPRSNSNSFYFSSSKSNWNKNSQETLFHITQEIICYMEVVNHKHVLKGRFYYLLDYDDRLNLIKVENFIVHQLSQKQLKIVHDRYKMLQQIGNQQLYNTKQSLYVEQNQMMWQVCTNTLVECLERRKIQLKIDFVKPSYENLKAMFIKIIPNFDPKIIFQNNNWKNQLGQFLKTTRKQIDIIIRKDQGIRILKRFGIVFFRTFD